MRILFTASHTLYLKVLIPVIIELANRGCDIVLRKTRPDCFGYSPASYSSKPTHNNCVNLSALRHIASVIGYAEEFAKIEPKIKSAFFVSPKCFDAAIGTIKNLAHLIDIRDRGCARVFAVGYQHYPVFLSLTNALKKPNRPDICEDVFLGDNPFSGRHNFAQVIKHPQVRDYSYCQFLYMDRVYGLRNRLSSDKPAWHRRYALLFHPGGYRDVITPPNASQEDSYRLQADFIQTFCAPLLSGGFQPVLKTHPLYARHHSLADLNQIRNNLSAINATFSQLIVTDEPYWNYAFDSAALLSLGSSSLYELYLAGLDNVFVCAQLGRDRTDRFAFLESIVIPTQEEYERIFASADSLKETIESQDELIRNIQRAYSTLFCGDSAQQIADEIIGSAS